MIGRKLAERLARDGGLNGQRIDKVTLLDVVPPAQVLNFAGQMEIVAADLSEPGKAARALEARPDTIFHLAGVVSGEAELDFDKGYRVNLDGTRALLEAIRSTGDGYRPRLVYTSSIAVFGAPFPAAIPDDFHLTPLTSYGTQKAIGEALLADYTRRQFCDGVGIRLPSIVVRPGKPNKAASGFFSGIIREPFSRSRGDPAARGARRARQSRDARRQLHGRRADRRAAPHCRRPRRRAHPARPRPAGRAHRRGMAAAHRRPPRPRARLQGRELVRRDRPHPHRRRPRRHVRRLSDDRAGSAWTARRFRPTIAAEPRLGNPPSALARFAEGQSGTQERSDMKIRNQFYLGVAAIAVAAMLPGSTKLSAQQSPPAAVAIDNDDIGGVVTGANGPEAGVWVIAETRDLPTRYAKMVVTDDQGRYVVPDLPKAKYKVWVRGYGLLDSPKLDSEPGKIVNHRAAPAANDAEAAKGYPAIYWYSMLKIPDASQFGGKSDIPEKVRPFDWLNLMKNNGCVGCHQLGQLSTRTLPQGLGEFSSHTEAWVKRTQAGQAGELM